MTTNSLELLTQLEAQKAQFGSATGRRIVRLLSKLERVTFDDVDSLIRFHEALLFLRAHPHNRDVLRATDRVLRTFGRRVDAILTSGQDVTALDYIEYSGISHTTITGHFSYDIVRWLVSRFPGSVDIAWERHERRDRLGSTLPRFLPLLEEDAFVEANIPYLDWIRSARPRDKSDLEWLIGNLSELNHSEREKAELYDSLELWVRWQLGDSHASRTRNIQPVSRPFYHEGPLIQRREVSLQKELAQPLRFQRLSAGEGLKIIDMLRMTTTVRYRELYGITHGDSKNVIRTDVGRGVEIFLWGLPRERRLPLRAYHLGFTLKNGVPINYIEGITLCGKMEVGFNTFYTFRDGESAWVYAQVLRVLRHAVGAECFSIDPYQLGFNNEEAIESGAFWFYRKLGFRPTRPELAALMEREERKIAGVPAYRTRASTLRKLSTGNVVYEVDPARRGEWDRFQVRNLGLAVQRRMAREFDGDAARLRDASVSEVARTLNVGLRDFNVMERQAFENLALVFALIRNLRRWSDEEKRGLIDIVRAKASVDESRYSRLFQEHARLRKEIVKLGSPSRAEPRDLSLRINRSSH